MNITIGNWRLNHGDLFQVHRINGAVLVTNWSRPRINYLLGLAYRWRAKRK